MHIVLMAIALLLAGSATAAPMELTIDQGRLQGTSGDGIAIFKGIPYAAPPVGVRRWRAPEPAAHWDGVRLADAFAPQCEQLPYPEASMFTRPSPVASEDCLYLNVWTANVGGATPQAVMVWMHGGGLTRGSGASAIYDGAALARKGVVLVTINYRLGAFGYLAHPALSAEAAAAGGKASSGNYGTLDQVLALQWVQQNIAAFGGDPGRVTIFGESAGSWSVNHMTATPLAAGLFHRAIGQSGASFGPMPELTTDRTDQPSAQTLGARFAKHLGAADLATLRALPATAILQGFADFPAQRFSQPNVDGYVFPDQIARIFARGEHNAVDLIVGSNDNEGINLLPPPKDADAVSAYIDATAGSYVKAARSAYDADTDWRGAYYNLFRDTVFTWNMRQWADAAAANGDRTYLYYFSYTPPSPMEGKLGAYHAAEIRYVFDNAALTFDGSAATPEELALAATLSDYWVSFAKTGQPKSANGSKWPRYQPRRPRYLDIAATPRIAKGVPQQAKLAVVDEMAAELWARWEDAAAATASASAE